MGADPRSLVLSSTAQAGVRPVRIRYEAESRSRSSGSRLGSTS